MSDKVRVLRVIEYVGERELVEKQISKSLRDGTHSKWTPGMSIKIATVGDFPEMFEKEEE